MNTELSQYHLFKSLSFFLWSILGSIVILVGHASMDLSPGNQFCSIGLAIFMPMYFCGVSCNVPSFETSTFFFSPTRIFLYYGAILMYIYWTYTIHYIENIALLKLFVCILKHFLMNYTMSITFIPEIIFSFF